MFSRTHFMGARPWTRPRLGQLPAGTAVPPTCPAGSHATLTMVGTEQKWECTPLGEAEGAAPAHVPQDVIACDVGGGQYTLQYPDGGQVMGGTLSREGILQAAGQENIQWGGAQCPPIAAQAAAPAPTENGAGAGPVPVGVPVQAPAPVAAPELGPVQIRPGPDWPAGPVESDVKPVAAAAPQPFTQPGGLPVTFLFPGGQGAPFLQPIQRLPVQPADAAPPPVSEELPDAIETPVAAELSTVGGVAAGALGLGIFALAAIFSK